MDPMAILWALVTFVVWLGCVIVVWVLGRLYERWMP